MQPALERPVLPRFGGHPGTVRGLPDHLGDLNLVGRTRRATRVLQPRQLDDVLHVRDVILPERLFPVIEVTGSYRQDAALVSAPLPRDPIVLPSVARMRKA